MKSTFARIPAESRIFHHRKIRFDVSVGRLDTLMAEPKGDHGRVHSRLEQVHRGGMPTMSLETSSPCTSGQFAECRRAPQDHC